MDKDTPGKTKNSPIRKGTVCLFYSVYCVLLYFKIKTKIFTSFHSKTCTFKNPYLVITIATFSNESKTRDIGPWKGAERKFATSKLLYVVGRRFLRPVPKIKKCQSRFLGTKSGTPWEILRKLVDEGWKLKKWNKLEEMNIFLMNRFYSSCSTY